MSNTALSPAPALLRLSSQIVSAHAGGNAVPPDVLPGLLRSVYAALANAEQPAAAGSERPVPAVPIKRSVRPDRIVCLEDGVKLKMLKRYLKVRYNMSPEQYRKRWGLPADYPMVAPSHSLHRSKLAKELGLGRRPSPRLELG